MSSGRKARWLLAEAVGKDAIEIEAMQFDAELIAGSDFPETATVLDRGKLVALTQARTQTGHTRHDGAGHAVDQIDCPIAGDE